MLILQPQSKISLCKVPFESDKKHNIIFKPTSEKTIKQLQAEYFDNLPSKFSIANDQYTFVRKDSSIKMNVNVELLKKYNYLYYTNFDQSITDQGLTATPFTIYCFILQMEYVNENCTRIYFETDVIQTYAQEIANDKTSVSYIERMHVSNDEIGANLISENLETGEYIPHAKAIETSLNTSPIKTKAGETITYSGFQGLAVAALTEAIGDLYDSDKFRSVNGIFSGLLYYVFSSSRELKIFIDYVDNLGQSDAIYTIFMIPSTLANEVVTKHSLTSADQAINYYTFDDVAGVKYCDELVINLNNAKAFKYLSKNGSYTPNNNKLYNSDYSYILISNGNGGAATFDYANFANKSQCSFNVYGVLSQGCSIAINPTNYKKSYYNYHEESLQMAKFPTCSWATDPYTNWLTQTAVSRENQLNYLNDKYKINQASQIANTISSVVGSVASIVSAGLAPATAGSSLVVGGAIAGASYAAAKLATSQLSANVDYQKAIADIEAEEYEHSIIPNKTQNASATTDLNFANGRFEFFAYQMQITGEFAEKIDNYFDRFGYKVAINGNIANAMFTRNKWNFIKTTEATIEAESIPVEYVEEIKKIFNAGITIWHDPTIIYKYNLASQNKL